MTEPAIDPAQLAAWDKSCFWHPFTQMQVYCQEDNLIFARGEGNYLFDVHGKAYLDAISSLWCNVHGHNHPRLNAALTDQLAKVAHSTTLGASNPPAILLAKRLVEIAPKGLEKVFYSEDGAEAVEIAVKMAFHYWRNVGRPEKQHFLTLDNAYHGDTVGAVSVGGMDLFHGVYQGLLFHAARLPSPYGLAREMFGPLDWDQPAAATAWLTQLEEALMARGHEIAALVLESGIQGAAGLLPFPAGILRGARELCDQYDVLLILDEVATGFGRTGRMFACEHEQVTPDLMCLGKGLSGGYLPLAATLASNRVYEAFLGAFGDTRQFYHGHTFTGNPLACAVALENLGIFEDDQVLAGLPEKIQYLQERLMPLWDHPHVGALRQKGLMIGIEIVADKTAGAAYPYGDRVEYAISRAAVEAGVYTRPLGDTLVLMPPLSISLAEIERMMEVILRAIDHVTS
ncbi:adenosylmethionine--8-amino-7-oxononanoate transaminase [Thermithiobacillus plumbiphilus]|uniref:Adenosylmethionine-8-amino-7-oxononanoate aminotransferase n=1 Tax=Thermithiobacillus plumbiphilus TaxID=1729899 RepID=A0ABU9DAP9_9PROT